MTRTEERLRDALGAAARTVRPGTLPPLTSPDPKHLRDDRQPGKRLRRWLVPAAAAGAVIAVAGLAVLLAAPPGAHSPAVPQPTAGLPPPDAAVLASSGVRNATGSVVKVIGTAPDCSRTIEGSGFVFAPEHVMTNAHNVAGVRDGPDVYTSTGKRLRARVVLYDYQRNIAVLYVPGLQIRPLPFTGATRTGDDAAVAGYPPGRALTAVPARIGAAQETRGPDIYQSSEVTRETYTIRANVQPSDAGGPLLAPGGGVYGVVLAAAGPPGASYALTAAEVAPDAQAGAGATAEVSTLGCD